MSSPFTPGSPTSAKPACRSGRATVTYAGLNLQEMYAEAGRPETVIARTEVAQNNSIIDAQVREEVLRGVPSGDGSLLNLNNEELTMKGNEIPTSENTMIVVIYGSNQSPGDGKAGFENLTISLRKEYKTVEVFSPGHNPSAKPSESLPSTKEALEQIKNRIKQALQENPQIKNIAINGYSWGGSTGYEIAAWIQEEKLPVKIVGVAYVDAVTLDSFTAENRLPPGSESVLNIYQSDATTFGDYGVQLNGGPIRDSQGEELTQIDLDKTQNLHSHASIDEASVQYILEFIQNKVQPNQYLHKQ